MKVVAMAINPPKNLLPLLTESPVLEDDNIFIDNDQSMLALIEMV